MGQRILVIGSEGFIGKGIVEKLLQHNYEITGADLLEVNPVDYGYYKISRLQPEFDFIFQADQFDYCINAAGSGNVPLSIVEPHRDFDANVNDTFKLLNAIKLHNKGCKYIH